MENKMLINVTDGIKIKIFIINIFSIILVRT